MIRKQSHRVTISKIRQRIAFVMLCLFSITTEAQQIPNGSFYYWADSYAPNGWGTWSSAISFLNSTSAASLNKLAQRDSVAFDYPVDSMALKLTVDTAVMPFQGLLTLAGFASLGGAFYVSPPLGTGLEFGYLYYTLEPDTLFFDYKYIPAGTDTAAVIMILTGFDSLSNSRTTILATTWLLGPSAQWQHNVTLPLGPYYNSAVPGGPDSLQLIFYSSVARTPQRGSVLWVDSVRFDAGVVPVTGIEDIKDPKKVYSYPNPCDDQLNIILPGRESGALLQVYDAQGNALYDKPLPLADLHSVIDTRSWPAGTYALSISSANRLSRYSGHICVSH